MKSGAGTIPAGTATLTVPSGWTVGAAQATPAVRRDRVDARIHDHAGATAAVNTNFRVSANWVAGAATGYTDQVVRIVSPVEGRFHRWGNWEEYDNWLKNTAPAANRLGRSAAIQTMAVGATTPVAVDVHNWSTTAQSGTVALTLPTGLTADAPSKPYPTLARVRTRRSPSRSPTRSPTRRCPTARRRATRRPRTSTSGSRRPTTAAPASRT